MPPQKYPIKLTEQERQELEKFISRGKHSARAINRARILLMSMEGIKIQEIASILEVSRQTIYTTQQKFCLKQHKHILDFIHDEPRTGRPMKIDSRNESKITMIACSEPPEGRAKWTFRLIADKVIELGIFEHVSHETIRNTLKKTN